MRSDIDTDIQESAAVEDETIRDDFAIALHALEEMTR